MDTVADELGASAWPAAIRDHLLNIQYAGRRQAALGSVGARAFVVVLSENSGQADTPAPQTAVGWVVTADRDDELVLVEIMVAERHRGLGIGSHIIRSLFDTARNARKPLRLHVNATNARAIRLYMKLGFRAIGGNEVQHWMEAV